MAQQCSWQRRQEELDVDAGGDDLILPVPDPTLLLLSGPHPCKSSATSAQHAWLVKPSLAV